jgi:transposase
MKKANVIAVKGLEKKVQGVLNDEGLSKSAKIKNMFDLGLEVKEIANLMGIRYNFAYNVISNYCNMNGLEVETTKKENKKDRIIELHLEGKSNKEISIELKTNYNYVFNTLKQYKAAQGE